MKYLYQRFRARRGQKVQVDFSKPTQIKLLGTRDFECYRKCRTNTYYGGHFEESPAIFSVPNDGEWVVVIEKGPMSAPIEVEGSVTILADESKLEENASVPAAETEVSLSEEENVNKENHPEEINVEQTAEEEETKD